MLSMLLTYDADGNVTGTLDQLIVDGPDGRPVIIDFEAMEAAGEALRLRDDSSAGALHDPRAVGAGSWPEWIGAAAHDFRVETAGVDRDRRISALVHIGHPEGIDESGEHVPAVPGSGHRRERAVIEAEIERRLAAKRDEARQRGAELREHLSEVEGARPELIALVPDPEPEPADIRNVVGGPDRHLLLDDAGRSLPWHPPEPSPLARFALRSDVPDMEEQQPVDGRERPATDGESESPLDAVPIDEP